MRVQILAALACAVVGTAGSSRAAEAKRPREIIDQAIIEAGGSEALARYKQPFRQKYKTIDPRGKASVRDGRITILLPDKLREENTATIRGQAVALGSVFNGKQGFERGAGGPPGRLQIQHRTMGAAEIKGHRNRLYAQWVSTLLPLDDAAFEFGGIEEIGLDERAAFGVRVSRAKRPDVRLYFDKETMMLVKLSWRPNETVEAAQVFDDFAELDGLAYPRKITFFLNGKPVNERHVTEFEFLDKVEDGTFEKF